MYDLHAHSCRSDGALTPAALVARAIAKGVAGLALTDHDTVAGWDEAQAAAGTRLELVRGIELTTRAGTNVHILGYFTGRDPDGLADLLASLRQARVERVHRMAEQLADHDVRVSAEEILKRSPDESIGRPHVALALVAAGHAADIDDAFRRYLRKGKPGFVPLAAPSSEEGVRRIRAAGGAPVVAHPANYSDDGFIEGLVPLGLAGIETYHPDNVGREKRYAAMVERWGLAATGGSDFHGHDDAKHAELGTFTTPPGEFDKLRRFCS